MFGKHLRALLPESKPTKEKIAAARSTATIANSQLAYLKAEMEYARLNGRKPSIKMLDKE